MVVKVAGKIFEAKKTEDVLKENKGVESFQAVRELTFSRILKS